MNPSSSRRGAAAPVACLLLAVFGALAFSAPAAQPAERQARIERLERAVLAPCCYDEPVSRHQSEIAIKMRLEIANWVAAGKSDQEILNTYVGLYGGKVLVDPRSIPAWWTPWIPWITLIVAVGFGFWLLSRWRRRQPPNSPPTDLPPLPDLDD